MKVGVTTIIMTDSVRDIYRLSAWLSPAFPVGAYTYSSGLEYAIEEGLVADADLLQGGSLIYFALAAARLMLALSLIHI